MAGMRLGIFEVAPFPKWQACAWGSSEWRSIPIALFRCSTLACLRAPLSFALESRTPDLLCDFCQHYTGRTNVESACVLVVCAGLDALRGVALQCGIAFFCVPHLEHTREKQYNGRGLGFDERLFDCKIYAFIFVGDGPWSFHSAGEVDRCKTDSSTF